MRESLFIIILCMVFPCMQDCKCSRKSWIHNYSSVLSKTTLGPVRLTILMTGKLITMLKRKHNENVGGHITAMYLTWLTIIVIFQKSYGRILKVKEKTLSAFHHCYMMAQHTVTVQLKLTFSMITLPQYLQKAI